MARRQFFLVALGTAMTLAGCNPSGASVTGTRSDPNESARGTGQASASTASAQPADPASVPRVTAELSRAKVQAGAALLVCAYTDREKCAGIHLEGAISYADLLERLPGLDKNQEIILYCA